MYVFPRLSFSVLFLLFRVSPISCGLCSFVRGAVVGNSISISCGLCSCVRGAVVGNYISGILSYVYIAIRSECQCNKR